MSMKNIKENVITIFSSNIILKKVGIFNLMYKLMVFFHFDNITRYFYIPIFKEYNTKGG